MPSTVDICNTALSHIGDTANVTSINPADGSAQAGYCARFYPIALNALLEMASWNFSTVRQTLAQVTNPSSTWLYAYAYPDNVINILAVLSSAALDDYSQNFATLGIGDTFATGGPGYPELQYPNPADNFYAPQPYALEQDGNGNQIILTNVDSAVIRYTQMVDDPNIFSPLFTIALSYLLASMLAGPIIKGDVGSQKSMEMMKAFQAWEAMAESSDANQRRIVPGQSVPWMAAR
jgi:hypothetical protein